MRLLRVMAATLLLAGGLGARAAAQTIPSPFRHIETAQALGLFGGYLWTDRGDGQLAPGSGPMFGAQYTGRFADPVAGVVRVWGLPSERTIYTRPDVNDLEAPLVPVATHSVTVLGAEGGLRLLLAGPRTWNSLAPFVEATAAVLGLAGSRAPEESELPPEQIVDFGPSFALGVGAGTDWFITDRVSLNVMGKGLVWRFGIPEQLSSTGTDDSEWTRYFGGTIGLSYHF